MLVECKFLKTQKLLPFVLTEHICLKNHFNSSAKMGPIWGEKQQKQAFEYLKEWKRTELKDVSERALQMWS